MKNILVKGVIIAGIAVGIAAISVAAQRFFGKSNEAEAKSNPEEEDELDVILKESASNNSDVETDEDLESGLVD